MATLYELTEQLQLLVSLAEDPDSIDMNPDIFADTFEGLEMEFEDKADGYARVITEVKSRSAALDAEIKRLQARKKACDNSADRMTEALKNAMISTGKTKFKTDLFSFGIQKNPPKLVKDCEDVKSWSKLPEFIITPAPQVDWVKVREKLRDPDESMLLDGLAHMERSESLRIR